MRLCQVKGPILHQVPDLFLTEHSKKENCSFAEYFQLLFRALRQCSAATSSKDKIFGRTGTKIKEPSSGSGVRTSTWRGMLLPTWETEHSYIIPLWRHKGLVLKTVCYMKKSFQKLHQRKQVQDDFCYFWGVERKAGDTWIVQDHWHTDNAA